MAAVTHEVPETLKPAAEAALAWLNEERGAGFRLTGLVDAERALAAKPGEPFELGLVLCEDELCLREQVRIEPAGTGFRVAGVEAAAAAIPARLDPPAGVRRDWLDRQLGRHTFVLLLFYRGLW